MERELAVQVLLNHIQPLGVPRSPFQLLQWDKKNYLRIWGQLMVSFTQCHMSPHPGHTSNLPGFCSRSSLLFDRYCQALALREEGIPFRQRSFT